MTWPGILTDATYAALALVVLVLVVYLTGTLIALIRAGGKIAAIADGLEQVAADTDPLDQRLATVNGALAELGNGLQAVDLQLVGIARVFRLVP